MKQILNLQMSVFGSFNHIGVDASTVSDLLQAFQNKLVPSVIQIPTFDLIKNSFQPADRLSMISLDKKYNIVFLPDRIDCNFTPQDQEISDLDLGVVFKEMCAFLKTSIDYSKTLGSRLAINGRYTMESSLNITSFILPIEFYKKNNLVEWSTSNNSTTTISVNQHDETLNNILSISFSSLPNPFSRLGEVIIMFDINTVQTDTNPRFSSQSINEFLEQAIKNLDEIVKSIDN